MTLTESFDFKEKYKVEVINVYKFSVEPLENIKFINGSILKLKSM